MLKKIELRRVLGQRRVERLIRAKWLKPIVTGRCTVFEVHEVHAALKRLERSGYELRPTVKAPAKTKRADSLEDALASLDLEKLL